MIEFPLEIFNISVVDTPFLKDYYWTSLNISRLNTEFYKFEIDNEFFEEPSVTLQSPIMKFPKMPINTNPIKIILHFFNNNTKEDCQYELSRIKCCTCQVQETQVAFNKYKKLFNCPHRYLLDITPRNGTIKAKESGILVLHVLYNIVGKHALTFKMTVNEKFIVYLRFQTEVLEFDPSRCLITKSLFPIQCFDYNSFYQPLWFYNPYGNDLFLDFCTDTNGLQFECHSMFIKKYSMKPFMIKYKPHSEYCTITISVCYFGIKTDLHLTSVNLTRYKLTPTQNCPKNDIPCIEAPYVIFENSITYKMKLNSFSTRMVAVHNYTKSNVMCKWITFEVPDFFKIEVSPKEFCCKNEHPVLCIVTVTSCSRHSIFHHIPVTCEIHKCKYPPLQPDEKLHSEMESIDDPLIFEPTLLTKIFINVNLVIAGLQQYDIDLSNGDGLKNVQLSQNYDRNCIEKILWTHIFSDDYVYLLGNKNIIDYSYGDCGDYQNKADNSKDNTLEITHNASIAIMRRLTSNAIEEISKQWRFIPKDFYSSFFY